MAGAHSLLAPSAAPRWARCAGSLLLSKGRSDPPKLDAASGTCTHWISEQVLKTGADPDTWLGQELEFDGFKFKIDVDRLDRVRSYVSGILREPGTRFFEHRVDTSPILGIPGQEGHSDTITLDPNGSCLIDETEYKGVLSVHDLKDGIGHTVWAKNNLQGLIYGASALYEFDLLAQFNVVRFCIHQPRLNHYDEWAYTRNEIEQFITIIRPAAKLAYDIYHGNVEFKPSEHLNPGEEQCMWCLARGSCPARAKRIVDMFASLATKHEIDDETLSGIYARLDEIESACKDFRGEALARALRGRTITGRKLVRGNRGKRFWKDKARAEAALGMVLTDEQMYEPKEIISPTAAENVLKTIKQKALYASLKPFVDQGEGGITLVPLADPRDPVEFAKFDVVPGM